MKKSDFTSKISKKHINLELNYDEMVYNSTSLYKIISLSLSKK